jgi:hypothetical protein
VESPKAGLEAGSRPDLAGDGSRSGARSVEAEDRHDNRSVAKLAVRDEQDGARDDAVAGTSARWRWIHRAAAKSRALFVEG